MIKELGCLQEAIISILAEDTIAFDTPFVGRFGLSMLLELKDAACEKKINRGAERSGMGFRGALHRF